LEQYRGDETFTDFVTKWCSGNCNPGHGGKVHVRKGLGEEKGGVRVKNSRKNWEKERSHKSSSEGGKEGGGCVEEGGGTGVILT